MPSLEKNKKIKQWMLSQSPEKISIDHANSLHFRDVKKYYQ